MAFKIKLPSHYLLTASYLLGYLVIHGGPCSTKSCFFYSPHQNIPLHCAVWRGHVVVVRCLVEKGADINIKDDKLGVSK